MERRLGAQERLDGGVVVHLVGTAEDRPAELHATFNDARAIVTDDPFQCVVCEHLRRLRLGVEKSDLVKAQPDLCVRRVGEAVEPTEACDVRCGESWVGLEAFEENN